MPDGSKPKPAAFDVHAKNYKAGLTLLTPPLPMIFEAWEKQKSNKNLLFLTYEDMVKDIDR